MAILGMDGFDHYPTDATGTGTGYGAIKLVENYSIEGDFSNFRIQDTGTRHGAGKYLDFIYSNAAIRINVQGQITDTIFISCAFKPSTSVTSNNDIIYIYDDTNLNIHVKLRGLAGALGFYNSSTVLLGSASTQTMTDGQWYWMEIKIKIHDTLGTVQLQMDGVDWINETGLDTRHNTPTTPAIGNFRLEGGDNIDTAWDDLVWQDDDGAFLGDSAISTFMPGAAVASSSWTIGGDTPAATRHESVDDIPQDGDTTYVYSTTNGHQDLYNIGTIANDVVIPAVGIHYVARKDDTGARRVQSRTYADAGADLQGGPERALNLSYQEFTDVFETTDGTTAWTKTLLDDAQFGVKVTL